MLESKVMSPSDRLRAEQFSGNASSADSIQLDPEQEDCDKRKEEGNEKKSGRSG